MGYYQKVSIEFVCDKCGNRVTVNGDTMAECFRIVREIDWDAISFARKETKEGRGYCECPRHKEDVMETSTRCSFVDFLRKHHACSDAMEWIKESGITDVQSAWQQCENPEWMLWLCIELAGQRGWPTRQQIALVACDIAESVIHLTREQDREVCRNAISAAREYANGTGTANAANAASRAASCAASRAASYADSRAAYAASYAASYAANEAYRAAYAAYRAAYAANEANEAADAAYAASYAAKRQEICDLIRARFDIRNAVLPNE